MSLVTLKVGLVDYKDIDPSEMSGVLNCIGCELLDYRPGLKEALILCQSNEKSTDDIILAILEAGYIVKRYYLI